MREANVGVMLNVLGEISIELNEEIRLSPKSVIIPSPWFAIFETQARAVKLSLRLV